MRKLLIIFATCLILFGCAKADFDNVSSTSTSTTEKYYSLKFERFLDSQPESMRDYHIAMYEATKILAPYLKLDGTTYVLDITESQAKDLGISREIYLKQANMVLETNRAIAKGLAEGKTVLLSDPQKTLERYKNPDMHTTLEKGYRKQKE